MANDFLLRIVSSAVRLRPASSSHPVPDRSQTGRMTCRGLGVGPLDRFLRRTGNYATSNSQRPTVPPNFPTTLRTCPTDRGVGSLLINKDTTLKGKPFLSLPQINLKKKNNAWDTLIAFNKNMINPIILATEPYSNTNNIIPKINQNLSAHYCLNGTSKHRASILIHKNLENHSRELKQFTTPDQVAIHIKHKDR